MSNIPVSYFTDFNAMSEGVRRCFWREMALHGAKHLVLVSSMITSIMTAPALKKQLESEMDEAGLDFCDAHAPYGPLWDMSCTAEDERSAMKLKQKIALETAAYFDVKTITMHIGLRKSEITPEKYFSLLCDALDDLLPYAEKLGIVICIENGWRTPLTLGYSDDNGRTWTKFRQIEDDGHNYCYTSMTFIGKTLLLSYYESENRADGTRRNLASLKIQTVEL